MIEVIRREQVELVDWGWIQMRSPVLYHAPYGTLAVFTDGVMHPGQGFDRHPHRNLEIVSVILEGEVTHQDSTGNITRMVAGNVQRITAGAGIYHAEHTTSPEAVRMFQIWFIPTAPNLAPNYAHMHYADLQPHNELYPIVVPAFAAGSFPSALTMQADGWIFMANIESGTSLQYALKTDRKLFIFVTKGRIRLQDETLYEQDHARIHTVPEITITAEMATQCIVIDVPFIDRHL